MLDLHTLAGTQIHDRFTLEKVVGKGASGVVYRAVDEKDGRLIALKLVAPSHRPEQSARYLRGTRLAAELRHPHIVETLDSGRWGPERRYFFLAMELVHGVALGRLAQTGLPMEHAVDLMIQVLEAAAYVHARGTIHRDLKPDNVMVLRRPDGGLVCKVTDFGIASNQQMEASVTQTGMLLGTPAYMAPEQAEQRPRPGPEFDLYAAGVMLYELLSGSRPFTGSPIQIFFKKLNEDPPPMSNADHLPAALVDTVMTLIARSPERRTHHARDAIEALRPFTAPAAIDEHTWARLTDGLNMTGLEPTVIGLHPGSNIPDGGAIQPMDPTLVDPPSEALWGRETLLERLNEHALRAESGDPQLVLLDGAVGVGKSAILRTLGIRLQEQGRFQLLSTTFFVAHGNEGGLKGAVSMHLGVRGQPREVVRDAIEAHMRRVGDDDDAEVLALTQWLAPDAEASGTGTAEGASDFSPGVRYLRRLARTRPVLLLLDDLHAGGPHGAALIDYLLFEFGFEPWNCLVVATTENRPSPDFVAALARSAHAEGRNRHTIAIDSIAIPDLTVGLRALFGLSTARAQRLAERAAGNPLVALALAHAQTTETMPPFATVGTGAFGDGASLQTMLSRLLENALEHLEDVAGAHEVLRAVALLGPSVDVGLLAQFMDTDIDDLGFETLLDDLIERDVLEEDQTPGVDRVSLKPRALSDHILAQIGNRLLRRMRRRAVAVLSEASDVDAGVIGDHHHALGDTPSALASWKKAELQARKAGAPYVAVDHGLKILASIDPDERAWWGTHLGRILLDAGDAGRAEELLRPVCDAPHVDDALVASDLLCDVYENMGKGAEWTALVERIQDRLPHAGRIGQHAAYCAVAMWSTTHSDDRAGRDAAEAAMGLAETPREIQRAAQRLAFSCLPSSALVRAEEAARKAVEASEGRPQMHLRSLRTLATVRLWRGDVDDAKRLNEEALALARWKGLSLRATLALHDLGDTLRLTASRLDEDDPERQTLIEQALDRYAGCVRAAEALDLESTAYLVRFKEAIARVTRDDTTGIETLVTRLTAPAEAAGLGLAAPCAHLITAWAHVREGSPEQARSALEGARILEAFQIDPQFPAIFAEIRAHLEAE